TVRTRNMTQLAPIRAERRSCPKCRDCGATTRLFGIEPHPMIDRADLLTYVCSHCDGVQTEIVVPAKLKPMGSLLANKAFDAETPRVLGSAFDAAWERVEASNVPRGGAWTSASRLDRPGGWRGQRARRLRRSRRGASSSPRCCRPA